MADTYAVVQKRRATSGPGSGSGACSTEGAPLYSHVTPGTRWPQAPTEEGAQLGGGRSGHRLAAVLLLVTTGSVPGQTAGPALGALLRKSPCLSRVPADPSPTGPGTYEDVAGGSQTSGLGFNLRIGRPKGPRDPPAEWTRV